MKWQPETTGSVPSITLGSPDRHWLTRTDGEPFLLVTFDPKTTQGKPVKDLPKYVNHTNRRFMGERVGGKRAGRASRLF